MSFSISIQLICIDTSISSISMTALIYVFKMSIYGYRCDSRQSYIGDHKLVGCCDLGKFMSTYSTSALVPDQN